MMRVGQVRKGDGSAGIVPAGEKTATVTCDDDRPLDVGFNAAACVNEGFAKEQGGAGGTLELVDQRWIFIGGFDDVLFGDIHLVATRNDHRTPILRS